MPDVPLLALITAIAASLITGGFTLGARFAVPKVEKQSRVVDDALKLVDVSGREIDRQQQVIAGLRARVEALEAENALLRRSE